MKRIGWGLPRGGLLLDPNRVIEDRRQTEIAARLAENRALLRALDNAAKKASRGAGPDPVRLPAWFARFSAGKWGVSSGQ